MNKTSIVFKDAKYMERREKWKSDKEAWGCSGWQECEVLNRKAKTCFIEKGVFEQRLQEDAELSHSDI